MHFVFFIASLLVSHINFASDYQATSFQCTAPNASLTLKIHPDNSVEQFAYFDGTFFWRAQLVKQNDLAYIIDALGTSSIIADHPYAMQKTLRFSLPIERPVIRMQTGGFYAPIYETYPFIFVLAISVLNEDGLENLTHLDCIGY